MIHIIIITYTDHHPGDLPDQTKTKTEDHPEVEPMDSSAASRVSRKSNKKSSKRSTSGRLHFLYAKGTITGFSSSSMRNSKKPARSLKERELPPEGRKRSSALGLG
jgi:hypothetical protein